MKKIGFTLTEVMIVLVVIGVITGILLPTAIQSTPDENVMKFKKGYSTLGQVIRELVNSGRYYLEGDLTTKPDGTIIDGNHEGDNTYLCETFADVLNVKKKNCKDIQGGTGWFGETSVNNHLEQWTIENAGIITDDNCNDAQATVGEEIVTNDNIIFYDSNPKIPFGITFKDYGTIQGVGTQSISKLYFKTQIKYSGGDMLNVVDAEFYKIYKIFCMDIDGINKGEAPFGFGIRFDGKIQPGVRAMEWMNKSIQKEE